MINMIMLNEGLLSWLMFFLTFAASLMLTGLIRLYTLKHRIVDVPNERSSHRIVTPRGGGFAIFLLVTSGVIFLWYQRFISDELSAALIIAGSMVALLGWCDDVYQLHFITRLVIQFLASLLGLFFLDDFTTVARFACDLFVILWSINLYNFMDGIDGLAGAEGLFISLITGLLLFVAGATPLASLCWIIAGAICGFLYWNWSPAKIFMGDVGSAYLGFLFSLFGIYTIHQHLLSVSYWLILCAVFIGDATFTLLKRMLKRQKWWAAHKQHAYQYLQLFGLSHRMIASSITLFNLFILLPLALTAYFLNQQAVLMLGLTIIAVFSLWFFITKRARGV